MDAKSRMNFINSVKGEKDQIKQCPYCGAELRTEARFCTECGKALSYVEDSNQNLREKESRNLSGGQTKGGSNSTDLEKLESLGTIRKTFPQKEVVQEKARCEQTEEKFTNAFAEGLPEWSLVPPNLPVRRRRRI